MITERMLSITLDEGGKKRSMEAEHEKTVALTDLLHNNSFEPLCMKGGPYDVHVSIHDGRLIFDITSQSSETARAVLPVAPLKRVIQDYFLICESYYAALKENKPHKLEAIDMGRRGIHNEGSEAVQTLLTGRIKIDSHTARRLFTLICVLQMK
ncbi:MAG: UPF0262 family protein [Pseudomonadota bacterium]|nr:UPF0262 family protein [Pseudomonadota bacterium]MDE3037796.1 UPF0262 family protein [Pseudomonadota bacterium]